MRKAKIRKVRGQKIGLSKNFTKSGFGHPKEVWMTKIAYNACFGGFSLSVRAVMRGRQLSGDPNWGGCVLKGEMWDDATISMGDYTSIDLPRTDQVLIDVIEELGKEASGEHALICIREVEPGTRYRIEEYDGNETVKLESEYEWEIA